MPVWIYKCPTCSETFRTKKEAPEHCGIPAERLLNSPSTKYMEKEDAFMGKSNIVGADKVFLERSRKYSRDVELDDLVQMNKDHSDPKTQGWITDKGVKRKAIDDL